MTPVRTGRQMAVSAFSPGSQIGAMREPPNVRAALHTPLDDAADCGSGGVSGIWCTG